MRTHTHSNTRSPAQQAGIMDNRTPQERAIDERLIRELEHDPGRRRVEKAQRKAAKRERLAKLEQLRPGARPTQEHTVSAQTPRRANKVSKGVKSELCTQGGRFNNRFNHAHDVRFSAHHVRQFNLLSDETSSERDELPPAGETGVAK